MSHNVHRYRGPDLNLFIAIFSILAWVCLLLLIYYIAPEVGVEFMTRDIWHIWK